MNTNKYKSSEIAIITTVANFNLYFKTNYLFPKEFQRYVIDGRNGMHGIHAIFYMFKKLKNKGHKWLIMADEDTILTNANSIFRIIRKMDENDFVISGVRDGGVISHRNYNPNAINTFFSILNFEKLLTHFNKDEILNSKINYNVKFSMSLPYKYDLQSNYEPYYCFYFWIIQKGFKILYLDTKMHNDDGFSNELSFHNKSFLIHTWYARSYGINNKHTKRIDNIFKSNINSISAFFKPDYILFRDPFFSIKQNVFKIFRKLKMNFF